MQLDYFLEYHIRMRYLVKSKTLDIMKGNLEFLENNPFKSEKSQFSKIMNEIILIE